MSDHAVHTFYPVTLGEAFLPILIICLIAWPAHLSLINVLNIYCILCLNIVCYQSWYTKPCGHTTLIGLITEAAPVYIVNLLILETINRAQARQAKTGSMALIEKQSLHITSKDTLI